MDVDAASDTSSSLSSCPSSSVSSSAAPTPAPQVRPPPSSKPLTRRQRKALGLPKPRPAGGGGSGKITIPGGKYRSPTTGKPVKGWVVVPIDPEAGDGDSGEWKTNGVGRLDVRGFRELRI
jgi:hypothetical protein